MTTQLDGMAVYDGESDVLVGHTRADASVVRKALKTWDDVVGRDGCLTARGVRECWARPDVATRIFARFGKALVNPTGDWRNDPATDAQTRYLVTLRVRLEENMTKKRASQLIDAAKAGTLGAVGGFYTDGSN